MIKKCRFFIIFLLMVPLFAEIGLRYILPDMLCLSKIIKWSNDPVLGYELMPNVRTAFYGFTTKLPPTQIEISDQGLRDRPYNLQKGDDLVRIALLGDSFTFGWGLNLDETIPKQLEYLLNENSSIKYEVMSCGVIGYNLIQEIQFLKTKVLKFHPDIIIFLVTGNDVCRRIEMPSNKFSNLLFTHSYLYRYIYVSVIRFFQKKDLEGRALEQSVQRTYSALEELKRLTDEAGRILVVAKNFSPWMQDIFDICKRNGFKVLDCSHLFRSHRDYIFLHKEDQHLNSQGCRLIANEIYGFLRANMLGKIKNFGKSERR